MRLSDVFRNLGKPVGYYPSLVKPLGSPEAVILFCQLLWWQDKTDHKLGVYKSVDELEEETGLTYKMQRNALSKLIDLNLIVKTHVRSEHKLYFKVDFDVFNEVLASIPAKNKQLTKGKVPLDQMADTTLPKGNSHMPKGHSVYIEQENTTENTHDIKNNKKEKSHACTKLVAEEIKNKFNEILVDLPSLKIMSDKRLKELRLRWNDLAECYDKDKNSTEEMVSAFESLFKFIAQSDFLTGRNSSWCSSFDWIFKQANFIKILEGNYENKEQSV